VNQPGGAAISRGEGAVEDLVFDILSGGTFDTIRDVNGSRVRWIGG
jgi:hypothetical protein